jgi:hypothetical protein
VLQVLFFSHKHWSFVCNWQVRLEFLNMIGNWMLTLTERLDHESRLLPYVLSGLTDDCPAVQAAAVQLLEQLGAAYEKEHEKELLELYAYGGEDLVGGPGNKWHVGYGIVSSSSDSGRGGGCVEAEGGPAVHSIKSQKPKAAMNVVVGKKTAAAMCTKCQEEDVAREACGADAAAAEGEVATPDLASSTGSVRSVAAPAAPAAFPLPGPFKCRPGLGVRRLVQSNFCRVVGAIAAELSSWQAEPRAKAAQLLLVNLVVLEDQVEGHLHLLLPALCKVRKGFSKELLHWVGNVETMP